MVFLLSYPPYGWGGSRPESSMLKFNGEMRDKLNDGYHLGKGKRLYLPTIMRFTSPDDFSPFLRGGINCYAYCLGDPVNYMDTTGRVPTLQNLAKRILKDNPELIPSDYFTVKQKSSFRLEPTPRVEGGRMEYHHKLIQYKSADEVLKSSPHLKTHVKFYSRMEAISGPWMHPESGAILSKHKGIATRFDEFQRTAQHPSGEYLAHIQKDSVLVRVQSVLEHGFNNNLELEPGDSNKLIRWAKYLDETKPSNPTRPKRGISI
ncbi:RHS repeat-associated core domain-containing protein [Pseudomonas sp. DCB_AW]|uniref:RHS repeat-associated core domain-containing protein n=1 Tax=Pseudomonas sp. DCB_AW TaxID=2993596 RepID=UPI0022491F43|nr:RHS repeat-associated core domain-containing protein [Pseudomonas sp. DCB_AW]MCX2684369.1 RHS repeat-associated core domain-containing protein [Pseudomonas sp. DCB_AW]